MNKQELLDIILDLPANQREQLADEIYQSLDAVEDDLNAAWIVEANRHMRRLEDTPPSIPEEAFDETDEEIQEPEEVPHYEMIRNVWEYIDRMRFHFGIDVASRDKREGIPSEQFWQELQQRREQEEELFSGLEATTGPAPGITSVRPQDDFKLHLTFEDGKQRIFDMKPYRRATFAGLADPEYFSWVRVKWGGIRWPNGETMYSRRLYKNSKPAK